jgi:hypothetical protein
MNYQHVQLAAGRWNTLSFFEQMANIGSEIERAITWKNKGNAEYSRLAFERALELLDLTINASIHKPGLKELTRLRETLADYFVFDNSYSSTEQSWHNYFYAFTYAARLGR